MTSAYKRLYEEHYELDSASVPMGIVCHYADGDEEIFHVNDYILRLFECATVSEFLELTQGSFKNFAYDRNLEETSLGYGVDGSSIQGVAGAYFRIKTRRGRLVPVSGHGQCTPGVGGKRPRCFMSVIEMTPEVEADWLTGLPSMVRFHALSRLGAVEIQERGERPAAIALDVMGMKDYNTRYSRGGGDEMLRALADVLRAHFGAEACSRLAEDHFYAYTSERAAEPTVKAVLRDFHLLDPEHYPPVRAGIYALDEDDDIVEVGFDRAKAACDLDRKTWSSHLAWFTDEMRGAVRLRQHVLESIDQAIAENWIRPHYQAIVRSATGDICNEEALARWIDPEFGSLAPYQFIPDLEDAGLLYKLDLHIVDCVIEDLRAKLAHGVPVVPVSINFSLRDLREVNLAHEISQRLDAAVLPRSLIRIELTESVASSDPAYLHDQVVALHAHGFEVWMDDFGSGYSSLNTLQEFDFDLIKLDMGFLRSSKTDRSRVILAGVVQAAALLGVGALCEGVETEEQAAYLASIGCDMLQGFYYARPNPIETIIEHHGRPDDMRREPFQELKYWNDISLLSFTNLAEHNDPSADWVPMSEFPIAVLEMRNGQWRIVRANDTYIEFLTGAGVLTEDYVPTACVPVPDDAFDQEFYVAADRARMSGSWERIFGRTEYGTGFQFYLRHVASTSAADAYLVSAAPTMLGSGLGTYGDVPVAYAVFRVVLNGAQDAVIDTEYVYANNLYCEWGGFALEEIIGKSFLHVAPNASTQWFPNCYRAAVLKENVHEVVYSPEANHWLSCNIAPSLVEGCCVYAFTIADDERNERDAIMMDRDTAEHIVRIADILNGSPDYDTAMQALLDAVAEVIQPDRLYIFERGEQTTSNTFEWCAPGVEPMIDTLQDLDNSEFDTWEELLAKDDVVVIPDVEEFAESDPRMYWQLTRQGITHLLAVPFYSAGKLIGYLGADNYMLTGAIDSIRLLKTAASYVSARMGNRRLMDDLERMGTHDALTGMLSRRGIDRTLAAWLEAHEGAPFSVALMDVDEFKALNDEFGHQTGDDVLCELGRRVIAAFPEGAIVGRNGGDEFLAFLGGEDAPLMDACLATLTAMPYRIERDGRADDVCLSCGYVLVPEDAPTLREAYSRADAALFSVKIAGKGHHRRYHPTMETQVRLQSGFTPRDIIENVPGAVCCHRPDSGELLLANESIVRLFECDDLEDFMAYTGAVFAGIVHPDDRERVREELIAERENAGEKPREFDVFDFRIITKAGNVRHVADMGHLVRILGVGEVFYELIVDLDALCGCGGGAEDGAEDTVGDATT